MSSITVRHDLRGRFGPARDQKGRETCLAFAASDAHAVAIGDPWSPLCCEYLFFQAKQRERSPADRGTTIAAIRAALEHDGQPSEAAWPYLDMLPTDLTHWKPPDNVGMLYRRRSERRETAFKRIWDAVESDQPTLLGMTLSGAFFGPDGDGVIDADEPKEDVRHALLAVGTGERASHKLMLVRNSWGATWGLSGYAWLSERYLVPRIKVALAVN